MSRFFLLILLLAGAAFPAPAAKSRVTTAKPRVTTAKPRIKRSPMARRQFESSHPCPSTGVRSGACPGYVVDHVVPLACGGADAPHNMQWQTKAAGKAKDRWERSGCKAGR